MKRLILGAVVAMALTSCSNRNSPYDTKIVIGCSPTPHAEILEFVKPFIKERGYTLDIKIINDYVTPNTLLKSGDLDANYFQHVPYLDDFNAKNGTDIIWTKKIHFEPMGVYSLKHQDLTQANPKIAIPNDVSNGQRARDLLEEIGLTGTIIELEAQAIPSVLQDVDYGVINGNYALSAKITNKCIVTERTDSDIALTNANVIAIDPKYKDQNWVKVLNEEMTNVRVKDFIDANYGAAVKAVF